MYLNQHDALGECNNLLDRCEAISKVQQTISDYMCETIMRVMNTSSSDAVLWLTNVIVIVSAIVQFRSRAGQQHPARRDQSNLLPGSSSDICLSQSSNTSSLALNGAFECFKVSANLGANAC